MKAALHGIGSPAKQLKGILMLPGLSTDVRQDKERLDAERVIHKEGIHLVRIMQHRSSRKFGPCHLILPSISHCEEHFPSFRYHFRTPLRSSPVLLRGRLDEKQAPVVCKMPLVDSWVVARVDMLYYRSYYRYLCILYYRLYHSVYYTIHRTRAPPKIFNEQLRTFKRHTERK